MRIEKINYQLIVIVFIITVLNSVLFSQNRSQPMMSSTKDGVHIIIRGKYSGYTGFNIYRKNAGFGEKYKLLSKTPILDIDDIYKAQEILGANCDYLRTFLKTNDPKKILLRMKSPDVATILRYCGVPFAKVLGRHYFDSTAKWGEEYEYKVVLLGRMGKELQTFEVEYTVEDELPKHTTKMEYEQRKTKIRLTWDTPEYNEDVNDDFVGYNLYRTYQGKTKRLNFLPVLRRNNILWIDDEVIEEKKYEYLIKPVDVIGREGETSAKLSVYVKDLIAPLVPEGLSAEKNYDLIKLSWNKGFAKDIVNYNILRGESLKAKYTKIAVVEGEIVEYIDSSLVGGKPYFYKLQAIDNVGNTSLISPAIWSVANDSTAPAPLKNITFEIGGTDTVTLKWDKSISPDLQGYFVSRGYNADKSVKLTPKSIVANEFTDIKTFNPGHKYYYHISAIDLSFNQSSIQTVEVKIPDNKPPYASKYCDRILTNEGYVRVNWQPSMSLDVQSYELYRYNNNIKKLIKTTVRTVHSFTDSTVTKGVEYIYAVIALDDSQNKSVEVKSKAVVPKDINPPPPPKNIIFKIVQDGVEISWDSPTINDSKGFNIYRASSKDGNMVKINKELLTISKYHDKTDKSGMYYKITLLDTSGNETASSIYRAK